MKKTLANTENNPKTGSPDRNEVKAGYKNTEIGVIPENWNAVPVGEAFDFKNGLNKAKEFFGYGIPIVNYMDVFNHFGVKQNDIKGKVFLSINEIRNFEVRKGDVFFTRTSETVEEIGMSSVMMDNVVNTVFSGFLLRGREKKKIFDLSFKKYCFRSFITRKQISSKSSYTTRALTNGKLLSKVLIPTPSDLEEQRAIATALSDTDELISSLDKLITKKKNIKQATMKQLLTGKKRLPGFSGEWEVKKLGEVSTFRNGAAHERYISDLGEYIVVNSKFISTEGRVIKRSSVNLSPLFNGEIAMVMSDVPNGGALAKCFVFYEENKYTLNQRICAFKVIVANNRFLFYLLNRNKYFLSFDSGVGQTNLKRDEILNCQIKLPPTIEEQKSIANALDDMDLEIEALGQKRDKYKAIKSGMMQQLLTGKIRLV